MPDHVFIPRGTPESRAMVASIQRGIRLTERLNAIPAEDADRIRAAWSELTGQPVDPTFALLPPIHVQHGLNIRVGRNVFINQGCTLMDIGGIEIGEGAVVGAGAVVTGDVPPATLVAGVPARIVRRLDED